MRWGSAPDSLGNILELIFATGGYIIQNGRSFWIWNVIFTMAVALKRILQMAHYFIDRTLPTVAVI